MDNVLERTSQAPSTKDPGRVGCNLDTGAEPRERLAKLGHTNGVASSREGGCSREAGNAGSYYIDVK